MSMPVIRLRQFVQFPANVYGDTGIAVTKANGNFTIETDWSGFGTTTAIPSSPTNYVLTYDTASGVYVLVPSSLLGGGGGGGGGIADAPSDGFSYGRLSAAWAKVAPLVSPALTGTPTAPTAAPATNTTQIATTAFVAAAVSSSGGVTPSALTKTNDTNVTLTLGGTPATALLQATSITAGWAGTLAAARGGFGSDISASNGVPLFATGAPTFTSTTGTGNFVRAISPTFTGVPIAPTAAANTNTTQIATTAFVTGQMLAANVAINGDFRINQSGYVSATTLSAGIYGHDQWKAGASGGDYSFTQLNTSTQITIASGKSLIQPIEDANIAGGPYVLSWTGTAQARAGVNTLTPSGSYATSPLLITGQTVGTVMSIEFNAGTLGTVKLERGSTATPFIMRSYDQELQMCQRYFYSRDVTGKYVATLQAYSTTSAIGFMFDFPVTMRAAPTATYSSISNLYILDAAGSPVALSVATISTTPNYAAMAPCTGGAGLVAGNAAVLYALSTFSFMFAARL